MCILNRCIINVRGDYIYVQLFQLIWWPITFVSFVYFQVVNMFNMFITYGDTFLPNPNSYDELYYELIRMHQVFDNLYSMGKLRIIKSDDRFSPTVAQLTSRKKDRWVRYISMLQFTISERTIYSKLYLYW